MVWHKTYSFTLSVKGLSIAMESIVTCAICGHMVNASLTVKVASEKLVCEEHLTLEELWFMTSSSTCPVRADPPSNDAPEASNEWVPDKVQQGLAAVMHEKLAPINEDSNGDKDWVEESEWNQADPQRSDVTEASSTSSASKPLQPPEGACMYEGREDLARDWAEEEEGEEQEESTEACASGLQGGDSLEFDSAEADVVSGAVAKAQSRPPKSNREIFVLKWGYKKKRGGANKALFNQWYGGKQ